MAIESQSTKFEIGTGTGGAKTVSEIALGYPTILTATAHGLKNGDVVTASLFAGEDAALLNGISFVVKYATTNTLSIDVDTTGKDVTDNTDGAKLTPVTYTEIGEVTDFSGPDGSASEIDVTHLRSTAKEFLMGLPDEGNISLSINWDQSDLGQAAIAAARTARTEETFKITYSDGSTATFDGYVLGLTSSGSIDGKVDGSITIRITGAVTWA
jgi:hypothetical protein